VRKLLRQKLHYAYAHRGREQHHGRWGERGLASLYVCDCQLGLAVTATTAERLSAAREGGGGREGVGGAPAGPQDIPADRPQYKPTSARQQCRCG
jgi:hypothetical protein